MKVEDVGIYLNKLQKKGISTDIIKAALESYGKEGGEWLLTASGKDLGDTFLQKIVSSGNALKYSDKLLDVVKASDGCAEDIIEAVSKYGDDATKLIKKHGGNAAKAIKDYGDDAVKLIGQYGENAAEAITQHGEDAVDAMKKGIDPDLMKQLDELEIKPKDYAERGITSKEAAEKVIKGESGSLLNKTPEEISNMTRKELEDSIPDNWDFQNYNGRIHIKDENKNSLDIFGNIVSKKDPAGHIPYKN